jgi:hypothetical protein
MRRRGRPRRRQVVVSWAAAAEPRPGGAVYAFTHGGESVAAYRQRPSSFDDPAAGGAAQPLRRRRAPGGHVDRGGGGRCWRTWGPGLALGQRGAASARPPKLPQGRGGGPAGPSRCARTRNSAGGLASRRRSDRDGSAGFHAARPPPNGCVLTVLTPSAPSGSATVTTSGRHPTGTTGHRGRHADSRPQRASGFAHPSIRRRCPGLSGRFSFAGGGGGPRRRRGQRGSRRGSRCP